MFWPRNGTIYDLNTDWVHHLSQIGDFIVTLQPSLVATFEEMEQNLISKDHQIIDTRPPFKYAGSNDGELKKRTSEKLKCPRFKKCDEIEIQVWFTLSAWHLFLAWMRRIVLFSSSRYPFWTLPGGSEHSFPWQTAQHFCWRLEDRRGNKNKYISINTGTLPRAIRKGDYMNREKERGWSDNYMISWLVRPALRTAGVDTSRPIIVTCNAGMSSATMMLCADILKFNAKLYVVRGWSGSEIATFLIVRCPSYHYIYIYILFLNVME